MLDGLLNPIGNNESSLKPVAFWEGVGFFLSLRVSQGRPLLPGSRHPVPLSPPALAELVQPGRVSAAGRTAPMGAPCHALCELS